MVSRYFARLYLLMIKGLYSYVSTDLTWTRNKINENESNNESCTYPCLHGIEQICPGVEYLLNVPQANWTFQQVNASDCKEKTLPEFPAQQGVVFGLCGYSTPFCRFHVKVQRGKFVLAHLRRIDYLCNAEQWVITIHFTMRKMDIGYQYYDLECTSHSMEEKFFVSRENDMLFSHKKTPGVKIDIETIEERNFIVEYSSSYSGYVTLPAQGNQILYASNEFRKELIAPTGYIIVVSFQGTSAENCDLYTKLTYTDQKKDRQIVVRVCDGLTTPAAIFPESYLQISLDNPNEVTVWWYIELKMLFTFISEKNPLEMLQSGLFNCSGDGYSSVRYHLDCNLKPECEDGRDETEHCPFSSPGCQGMVASRNKCFKFIRLSFRVSYTLASYECKKFGGILASIRTRMEQKDIARMLKTHDTFGVLLGFTTGWYFVPFMYSKFATWSGKALIYDMVHFTINTEYNRKTGSEDVYYSRTATFGLSKSVLMIKTKDIKFAVAGHEILCETKPYEQNVRPVHIVDIPIKSAHQLQMQHTLICSGGHMTQTALSCDIHSHCGMTVYVDVCPALTSDITTNVTNSRLLFSGSSAVNKAFAMFACDDDIVTVPFTLVCDFRSDCPEKGDEAFCEHRSCDGFLCNNSQCVSYSQRCNEFSDCLDDSDETNCPDNSVYHSFSMGTHGDQQFLFTLNGAGYFTKWLMDTNASCPETHYRCSREWAHCLPIYTICNEFSDCIYSSEDEEGCDTASCPGFYRCRSSSVCVHEDHLCDGWGQCPQRDDEWLCDSSCPQGCLCQGHSFLCPVSFAAQHFPNLRYLDATGSGMSLTDLESNTNLIHLKLSKCFLGNISDVRLHSLLYLDLTSNHIRTVNMSTFTHLSNLRILLLVNNSVTSVISIASTHIFYSLRKVDLSVTRLGSFRSDLSLYLSQVQYLNLSFSTIKTISSLGFKAMKRLKELDIRGNSGTDVPLDLFSGLSHLISLYSSDYKFCCKDILPGKSDLKCLSPKSVFSSCESILPTLLHRISFLSVTIFAIIGNLTCIIISFIVKVNFNGNFNTFVLHLQSAHVCMGVYTGIILVANEVLHEQYICFEKLWTSSTTCKVASILFILSDQAAFLITAFTTLDLVITLCFSSDMRCHRPRTAAMCAVTWFAGVLISVTSLLRGLPSGMHGQSGLCREDLSYYSSSSQKFKWYMVTVVFKSILSIIVMVGQVVIYRKTPKYITVIDHTKRPVYSSSRLLVKVAVMDAVCRFTIYLTSPHVLGQGSLQKANVVMSAVLLPFTSALHPLLYLWSVAAHRQMQIRADRLLHMLKLRLSLPTKQT